MLHRIDDMFLLTEAIQSLHIPSVDIVLKNGVDVNGKYFKGYRPLDMLLCMPESKGQIAMAIFLLEKGADVTEVCTKCLMENFLQVPDFLEVLLEEGLDANVRGNIPPFQGRVMMDRASRVQESDIHKRVMALLLKYCADLRRGQYLSFAVDSNQIEGVKLTMEYSSDSILSHHNKFCKDVPANGRIS